MENKKLIALLRAGTPTGNWNKYHSVEFKDGKVVAEFKLLGVDGCLDYDRDEFTYDEWYNLCGFESYNDFIETKEKYESKKYEAEAERCFSC